MKGDEKIENQQQKKLEKVYDKKKQCKPACTEVLKQITDPATNFYKRVTTKNEKKNSPNNNNYSRN